MKFFVLLASLLVSSAAFAGASPEGCALNRITIRYVDDAGDTKFFTVNQNVDVSILSDSGGGYLIDARGVSTKEPNTDCADGVVQTFPLSPPVSALEHVQLRAKSVDIELTP